MGQGPDHTLTMGQAPSASQAPPVNGPHGPSPTHGQPMPVDATPSIAPAAPPAWMEPAPVMPETRRGHTSRSGMNTLVFFGLITFVVAAAGIGGVVMWGPEKAMKNRTQFATNPPPPTELPS